MDMIRERTYFPAGKDKGFVTAAHVDQDAFESTWSWWHVGASLGIGAGLLGGLLGFILTTLTWLAGNELAASNIGLIGTSLIVGIIPLMILGAHSLDKIDSIKASKRIEYCKRNGFDYRQCK